MPGKYDLAILGGGPGGYPAAIHARQLGMSVALIERHTLGGTCLTRGCIPTKALIRAAHTYSDIASAKHMGISVDGLSFTYGKVQGFKNRIVRKLAAGTNLIVEKNGVDVINGSGKMAGPNSIDVDGKQVDFKNLIIAVGSKVRMLPAFPLDGKKIISSDQALELAELPANIGIVGAGAIGMEFAFVFRAFGSKVTILELMPRPMPMDDPDVSRLMWDIYKRRGIDIHCGFNATSCKVEGDFVKVTGEENGETLQYEFDILLVSIGREACTMGCNFEETGIELSRGAVVVDDTLRTNIPHIYAIGDCARPPLLARKATFEGIHAVESIAGRKREPVNYDWIPAATYTWPEVGSVGVSEETAKKRGMDIRTDSFSLAGNGKALIEGSQEGFIKAVVDAKTDKLLGISIVAPYASEILSAAVLALKGGLTARDLAESCIAHPTISEIFSELGYSLGDGPIHLPPS